MKEREIMNKIKKISFISLIILVFILFINSSFAILNPAAVYCKEMGYENIIIDVDGGERGLCKMPDGTEISAWNFLKGEEGKEYSYCEKKGYDIKTVEDGMKCSSIFSRECGVCILDNGDEIEVTKLMNLSFNEGICGDNICVIGENFKNCHNDCKSGSFDTFCDGENDKICDPDCETIKDPDCKLHTQLNTTLSCINGDGMCYCDCIEKDIDCKDGGIIKPCINPQDEQIFPKKKFNWLYIIIPLIILVVIILILLIRKKIRNKII